MIRRAIADNSGGYLGPAGPGGGAPCDVMFSWAVLRGTASNGDAGRRGFPPRTLDCCVDRRQ